MDASPLRVAAEANFGDVAVTHLYFVDFLYCVTYVKYFFNARHGNAPALLLHVTDKLHVF